MKETNQMSELTTANRLIENFINSCSHDLKGPVSSIKGLTLLIDRSNASAQTSQYLSLIDQSANRLMRFLKSLEYYMLSTSQEITIEEIDFGRTISKSLFELSAELKSTTKSLVSIKGDCKFESDRGCVELIIENLIENAHMYQKGGSKGIVCINVSIQLNDAKIEVCDNGEGISPHHKGHIFDMFFRASENSKGSGMGLFLVKKTVSKLKGKIEVSSSKGVGTNFSITLPNNWMVNRSH